MHSEKYWEAEVNKLTQKMSASVPPRKPGSIHVLRDVGVLEVGTEAKGKGKAMPLPSATAGAKAKGKGRCSAKGLPASLFEKQQQDDDEQQCCDSPSVASAVVAAFLDDLVTSLRAIKDRTRRLAKLREAIRILHGCKDVSFSSVEKNYIAQHVAGGAGSFTKEELASEEDFCENHDRRM
jgi:hypothetical protein